VTALKGLRIVELAESPAGEYCGKLLADFGAEVIKIEGPHGSPTRALTPMVSDADGNETSGLFAYLNTNKKSVDLDLGLAEGVDRLHDIMATADAVIDDHDPSWGAAIGLGREQAEQRHGSIIFCSITPHGADASPEWRHMKGLNVFHSSGWGYHTPTEADPGKPPLKGAGRFLVEYEAGLDAALCVVSSLVWRHRTGRGQIIDISQKEVMVSRIDCVLGRMMAGEVHASRDRRSYDMQGPSAIFPCADGYVFLYAINRNHWNGLKQLMDHPAWMDDLDDNWLEFAVTRERIADMRRHFAEWVSKETKDDVTERAQRLGVPLVPVNDASDVQRSPQFQFREYFQPMGGALYPTVPYKLSATPARLGSAAPKLGEHKAEILDRLRTGAEA
jgi:crotonobetainyl-CoA:carnitine CoA-transferase CaiB-like acyl-CoA transferase